MEVVLLNFESTIICKHLLLLWQVLRICRAKLLLFTSCLHLPGDIVCDGDPHHSTDWAQNDFWGCPGKDGGKSAESLLVCACVHVCNFDILIFCFPGFCGSRCCCCSCCRVSVLSNADGCIYNQQQTLAPMVGSWRVPHFAVQDREPHASGWCCMMQFTPPQNEHIPPWEKETHLQKCLGRGYVFFAGRVKHDFRIFSHTFESCLSLFVPVSGTR